MLENSYSAISTSLLCYYAFLLSGSCIPEDRGWKKPSYFHLLSSEGECALELICSNWFPIPIVWLGSRGMESLSWFFASCIKKSKTKQKGNSGTVYWSQGNETETEGKLTMLIPLRRKERKMEGTSIIPPELEVTEYADTVVNMWELFWKGKRICRIPIDTTVFLSLWGDLLPHFLILVHVCHISFAFWLRLGFFQLWNRFPL